MYFFFHVMLPLLERIKSFERGYHRIRATVGNFGISVWQKPVRWAGKIAHPRFSHDIIALKFSLQSWWCIFGDRYACLEQLWGCSYFRSAIDQPRTTVRNCRLHAKYLAVRWPDRQPPDVPLSPAAPKLAFQTSPTELVSHSFRQVTTLSETGTGFWPVGWRARSLPDTAALAKMAAHLRVFPPNFPCDIEPRLCRNE